MTLNENNIESGFEFVNWSLSGAEAINAALEGPGTLSGNESYYVLHLDAEAYAGTEANKYVDGLKDAAKRLYTQVTDMLKRIREYFSGEGKAAADAQVEEAKRVSEVLTKMTPSTPIPDDHPARNPETYIKSLEGGADFQELIAEDSTLKNAMDKVSRAFAPVKNAATVGQLKGAYAQAIKASEDAIKAISTSLDKKVRSAEQAANKLRNPKVPKESDPAEVSAGVKQESQEAMEQAKTETRQARIIGGMRNKVVAALGNIQSATKGLKEKMPKSKFKG